MTVVFLERKFVERFHSVQTGRLGGEKGVRDEGSLESALARAKNKAAFGETDIATLAAAYFYSLTMNCPFIEGNRRIALISAIVFLEMNGFRFMATNAEAYAAMMMLAAGEIDEDGATRFLRDFTVPL
ncbi:type II toxin-antitoxin system death-on-curing family toxin [Rhizobium sp. LjRoot254]|uniref:type II toxin-antitoxin system death-on-curing family toxin n=1 Tax=Rhizobium sp. LjRoot254 TaxID=3342297 RepID=UPI003ED07F53